MNLTVDIIKDYIKKEYDLDFKIDTYGSHRQLLQATMKQRKKNMSFTAIMLTRKKKMQKSGAYMMTLWIMKNGMAMVEQELIMDSIQLMKL